MKLVVTEYLSLDGIMEDPIWIGPYIDDNFLKYKFDELFEGDALLMGRKTYEYFVPVWASGEPVTDAPGQEGFADRVDQLPKYVVSSKLDASAWNNSHIVNENVVQSIRRLKLQSGQNLLLAGSATLLSSLMQANLVDEFRFLIFPVVVGQGKHLFDAQARAELELIAYERFNSGVIAVSYRPVQPQP